MYNLANKKTLPSYILTPDSSYGRSACKCLKFNPKQRDFLAVGYANRRVYIYKLTYALSHYVVQDKHVLTQLMVEDK